MPKFLINTVLAAALSLGAATTPVMADERTERLIVGAIFLGLLGAAIHETDRREQTVQTPRAITPLAPEVTPRRLAPRMSRALPAECLRRFRTRQGPVRLFEGTCLERNYTGTRHLPQNCAVTIRSHGQHASGFSPRCLRQAGYRLAGH